MKSIWVPVSAAIAQQQKVDMIANNVANANTPGFKKDQIVFKEYLTALDKGPSDIDLPRGQWSPEDFYHSHGAESSFVQVDGTYTIHQQGQLTPTKNPLDIAINGPGFFEVLTPNGIRYTRKGNFSISTEGDLVTDLGHKVLGRINQAQLADQGRDASASIPAPESRTIKIGQGKLSINMQGEIFLSGTPIGELSITEFKDLHALKKMGNSLYANHDNQNISDRKTKSATYQGFIEESNVNAVAEMAELIKANRHFQSIQKAIKTYDSISGKGIAEIPKF